MATHHTKDKGDFGVAKVFADLVSKGRMVLFPATEHAPFDLVAYEEPRFVRVQVKYRSAQNGAVKVAFRSHWSDRQGVHVRTLSKAAIDVVALYCPLSTGNPSACGYGHHAMGRNEECSTRSLSATFLRWRLPLVLPE